ncbi:MAG: hypothetical protein ACKPEY_04845, partial [Planctomycetota bacterium]
HLRDASKNPTASPAVKPQETRMDRDGSRPSAVIALGGCMFSDSVDRVDLGFSWVAIEGIPGRVFRLRWKAGNSETCRGLHLNSPLSTITFSEAESVLP